MAPPPLGSPQVPTDPGDAPRHDTQELPVTRGAMLQANRFTRVLILLVGTVVGGSSGIGGGWVVLRSVRAEAQDAAKAAIDAGLKSTEQRVSLLEQGQISTNAAVARQEAMTYELAKDIRALYRSNQTGDRSDRLERPPVVPPPVLIDGGHP